MAVPYKRFPIPEFDRDALKNMAWQVPSFISEDAARKLAEERHKGSTKDLGAHAITPGPLSAALFEKLKLQGEHRHTFLCLLPDSASVFGRSFAWAIQHAWIVDSLAADRFNALASWETPRPMNTRLGPEDGIVLSHKAVYVLTGHRYGTHWIANRMMIEPGWRKPGAQGGFAILAASTGKNDFHDCNLYFAW
jgi:hypothetical protein